MINVLIYTQKLIQLEQANKARKKEIKEEIEKSEEYSQLKEKAYLDQLTGIKNKTAFEEETKDISVKDIVLIMVDANYLKQVNDKFGHQKGDVCIATIAAALCQVFGKDACYRVGGDEFLVVIKKDEYQPKMLEELKKYLIEKSKQTELEGWLSAAVGVAIGSNETFNELKNNADKAMYADKKSEKEKETYCESKKLLDTDESNNFIYIVYAAILYFLSCLLVK